MDVVASLYNRNSLHDIVSKVAKNTFIPNIQFNKEFVAVLVGILGTTISPYLFFWQASMEVEEMAHKKRHLIVNKRIITDMKQDVDFGMSFSGVVMFFIILTTGTVLYKGGIHQIDTVEQAAAALKPLAGNFAYLLFAIGVIGTGLLAIPVLSGSLSYMNYIGISPIKALIYTAILYGLTAPVLIAIILHISNNKKVMGNFTNSRFSNVLGFSALILMTVAALALLYLQF